MMKPAVILLLCLCCCPLRAEDALSLEDALALAMRQNRNLLNQEALVEEAALTLGARREDFRPRPGLLNRAGRDDLQDRAEAGLELRQRFTTGGEARVMGGLIWTEDRDESLLRIQASQPLLRRAGSLVTLEPRRQAERSWLDARRVQHERTQDLVLEVVAAYEGVLRAARQVEADEHSHRRLENRSRRARVEEETGQLRRVDRLRIDFQLGEARTRLDNSLDILEQLRDEFANLLGLPPTERFLLLPPPLLDLDPPPLEEALGLALTRRLDLARARDALLDAGRQVRIARRDLLPDLRLTGDLNYQGEDLDLTRDSWFVGFVIEPDFSGPERRAGAEQAELRRERVARQLEEIHYAVQLDVRRALRGYQRANTNLRMAARNRELAEQRLALAENLYTLERGDATTLADAEDAQAGAVRDELSARTDASLSAYRLLRALGTLLEPPDDLQTP